MRHMFSAMTRISVALLILASLCLLTASAYADDAIIQFSPDTVFAEPGDTIVMTVSAVNPITGLFNNGLKGIHMVIGFNDAIVVPDTGASAFQPIEPGSLFPPGDSVTFFWDYLAGDSGSLTVDIFYLPDTQTIEGPGELLRFQLNAVGNGTTQVKFTELIIRDSQNRTIPVAPNGAWIEICKFPGDVNGDGEIDPVDIAYFVDFFFTGGAPPAPMVSGDVNCDGVVDPVDLAVMVDFFYAGGTMCQTCL